MSVPDYGIHKLDNKTDDFAIKFKENFHHFVNIQNIIAKYKGQTAGCGSYLSYNNPNSLNGLDYITDYINPDFYNKQVRLYNISKTVNNVLEVGVNTGHSILIMLLANPNMNIVGVDICPAELPYIEECIKYINSAFNNKVTFLKGPSYYILPQLSYFKHFDLIHIDAMHDYPNVLNEIRMTYMMGKSECYFLFDDYDGGVKQAVDEYVLLKYFKGVDVSLHHASLFKKID